MVWQHVRTVLLAGGVAALAAIPARADDCAPAPCAPTYRTVCVKEWVPEKYQCTRTVYKTECKTETYTAYRCETVPETRTRTCTVYERVPEVRTVVRHVCENVPTVETRTIQERVVTCKPVTKTVRKCVDHGHYECREVPCHSKEFRNTLHRLCHRNDCCEEACEPATKTVRVWVPCPVWEEHTVTVNERVCEYRPKIIQVTVCKRVMHEEKVQETVMVCKPVQKQETFTVCVTHRVPYQATRTVAVCVPHQEQVTATRMVCRTVEKQVPCEAAAETTCCKPAHRSLFRCTGRHHHNDCCD
jgi:hypothetical protein